MTPEGKVKDRIKRVLRKYQLVYWHMPVQNGMGEPTLDFVGCANARFFAIEAKAGTGTMTERQKITAQQMHEAGGCVFLINDNPDTLEAFENWLRVAVATRALSKE